MRIPLALSALAACSSHHAAIVQDASLTPDAGGLPVTFTVVSNGSGLANVVVYFQSADSTLLSATATDVTGTATGFVGSGGFVTAIDPDRAMQQGTGQFDDIFTWTEVFPGDHIEIGTGLDAMGLQVTVPTIAGATQYAISTTCGGDLFAATGAATLTATLELALPCTGPQDVEVVALDSMSNALGSIYVAAQPLAFPLDLTAQSYVAPGAPRSYTWTDPPIEDITLLTTDSLVTAAGTVYESPPVAAGEAIDELTATRTLASSTALDVVRSVVQLGDTTLDQFEWGQGTGSFVTDWGHHSMADLDGDLAYDATSRTVTFPIDYAPENPNGYEAQLEATRASDGHHWFWTVESAYQPIELPDLPTTLYDWNIGSSDSVKTSSAVIYYVPFDPVAIREDQLTRTIAERATGSAGVIAFGLYLPDPTGDARRGLARQLRLPFRRR